jgi:hypothetical protein
MTWLAVYIQDQGVGGSNPLSPTIFSRKSYLETGMSKINGDKGRQNLRDRRTTKMREKMRAIREKMNQREKSKKAS